MTVYLVLDPQHVRAQQALLRLWIGSLLRAVVRGGLQEQNLVHFVLDEAATLGHMDAIDDAVDKYRGYGVRLQFYFQSLAQLRKCFPNGQDQNLLSNCSQVYFAVNDRDTAQYVSDRLGEETIVVESGGISQQNDASTLIPWARQRERVLYAKRQLGAASETAAQARGSSRIARPTRNHVYSGRSAGADEVDSLLRGKNLIPPSAVGPGRRSQFSAAAFGFLSLGLFMATCLTVIVNDQPPMPAYRASEFRFEDFDVRAATNVENVNPSKRRGRRAVDQGCAAPIDHKTIAIRTRPKTTRNGTTTEPNGRRCPEIGRNRNGSRGTP